MTSDSSVDQEFITYVVKSIVDNPDAVEVAREVDEMGVLLSVLVSPEDMGNLIGRQGATAKALRTLLRIVGAKHNSRINLKILEPEGSTHVRSETPAPEAPAVTVEEPESAEPSVDDVLDELEQE